MIRRALLLALTSALILSALPVGATGKESGCRDVVSGGGSFEPNSLGLPDLPGDDMWDGGTLVFTFKLAAPACERVTYRVDVHARQTVEGETPVLLDSFAMTPANSDTFALREDIADATGACVSVVVSTLVKGALVDRAPDDGYPDVCENGGGGQGWN